MQEVNVMVTFCSRTGSTERLALAAALGAVQARAKIRLRWLREEIDAENVNASPEWKENRARMAREYIAPRDIDVQWADAMILAIPDRTGPASPHLSSHIQMLKASQLDGKLLTILATGPSLAALYPALSELSAILVPPSGAEASIDASRLHGRKLTAMARALKQN